VTLGGILSPVFAKMNLVSLVDSLARAAALTQLAEKTLVRVY
jgi:hypothetical protein